MTARRYRLAIDFGTSNTAAAVEQDGGRIHVLRLGSRSDTMPSAISLYDGRLVVGEEAVRLAGLDPAAYEPAPKRRLGEPYAVLGGQAVDPIDMVAAVLQRVQSIALQREDGAAPTQVVLTHPEAWGEHRRARLREAAARAGIHPAVTVLASEPVSAGWHYAASAQLSPGNRIAVVDFGGGTCDAALLDYRGPQAGDAGFSVVRVGGLDPLGGNDFDDLIYRWVLDQLTRDGRQSMVADLMSPAALAARLTLRDQVREAKHALSTMPRAPIPVSVGNAQAICTITRDEFDDLIRPQVSRAVAMTAAVLHSEQGSAPDAQLSQLFLTGGSSLVPLVQREFQQLTGGRVGTLGDPKQITCVGALQAPARTRAVAAAPPTGPVPLAARVPGRAGLSSSGRQRLLVPVGLAAVTMLVLVGAVAYNLFRSEPGSASAGGGTSTGQASPSPTVAASPSPSPSPSAAEVCDPGLTDAQCQTVQTVRGSWVEPGSCESSDVSPELHSVVCTPAGREKLSGGEAYLYLYRFDSEADLKASVKQFVADKKKSLDKPIGTDVAKPPAKDTWSFHGTPEDEVDGDLMAFTVDERATLIWTFNDEAIWAAVEVVDGDAANVLSWWQDPTG